MNITTCSVTVMRSHDYCHFSVTLGAELGPGVPVHLLTPPNLVDELRKQAARLADKAVVQYRIAKASRLRIAREANDRAYELRSIERIKAIAEGERTPEQQAELKAHEDEVFVASRNFDYQDDWDEDEESD